MEEYLRENAGGARLFLFDFFIIFKQDNKILESLEKEILAKGIQQLDNFLLEPKSTEFSSFITKIVSYYEFLSFNPEDIYGINQNQFRDLFPNEKL